MRKLIYADNAATTKMDEAAFEAMKPFMLEEYGNASQPYSLARLPKKALVEAREIIASCIGAEPDEIYFTSGGTESDNWAIKSYALTPSSASIITTAFEHHAILNSCAWMEEHGAQIAYLSPSKDGQIDEQSLRMSISKETGLVSVMYANNEIGSIQPIKGLAQITHEYGAAFHTDAVQAIGHVPIDVHALDIDILSASAHKFNGPKGVGFLYKRRGAILFPYENGGAQESSQRAGTENIAGIVGMAAALKANCEKLSPNMQHIQSLESALLGHLNDSKISFKQNGGANKLPGLLSLSFPGFDGEAILHRLDLMGIFISTGSACDSKRTQISHVLRAIQLPDMYAQGTIRVSLGKNNTMEEMVRIADAIIKCVKPLRRSRERAT